MNHSLYRYKKRMLILCIMLAVVLMITGVSYAVFTNYSSQTDANTLAASCMDLEFNGQNEINLLNTYPISEGEALEQTPYTFTIKNKCDNYIEYYVIASVISTTNKIDSKYVKVSLLGDNDLNGTVINTLESISTPQSLSKYNITENYILKRGDGISKDESRTFNFRMWLDSNNKDIWTKEDIEGKDYQVKISVVGTVKTRPKDDLYVAALIDGVESSTFPTTDKYTASVECTRNGKKIDANESITWNGTKWLLSTAISDGNVRCNATFITKVPTFAETILAKNEVKVPITTPGAAISTASEALLASAEDDYGTSYYFRGAVTNNYVEFANKCWRIVRVGGDGSVKLILHNDNTTGAANPCNSANNSTSAAFARYSGETYKSAFNIYYKDNTYVGFMYGTITECENHPEITENKERDCEWYGFTLSNSTSYATAHANTNKSTILTNLETWYNNSLKAYENVIADTVWCTDKTNVTDTTYDPWGWNPNGLGYGTNTTFYGATQRLVGTSGSAGGTGPSLKCNGELSKINSKVGLITADELAYAGYARRIQNTTTYLQENATGDYWWSLSPDHFHGSYGALGWFVDGGDGDFSGATVNIVGGVRPSISLKPSTNVTGDGTSENPYVVD